MDHTTQIEIERKYAVDESTPLPELSGITAGEGGELAVRSLEAVQLEAVYFDTADGALSRQRIALRRRQGGHDAGWHVKLPADEGRQELQWPLEPPAALPREGAESDPQVPAAVREAVVVHVRDHELTPLARLSTVRRITELVDASGAVVVEIADDTVTATDARAGVVRAWREWEAELGPAAPATREERAGLLDQVEAVLLTAGARHSPSVSKLAQALGRTGLGEPGSALDDAMPGSDSGSGSGGASDASAASGGLHAESAEPVPGPLGAGLRELVERIRELDPAVRADEPDAVHRMRVAVRRLKTVLAVRRADLPEQAEEIRAGLQRLGQVLGEARDLEVRAALAGEALDAVKALRGSDDADARRRLVAGTAEERARVLEGLRAHLSDEPYLRLLDSLEVLVGPAGASAQDSAEEPDAPAKGGKKSKSGGKNGKKAKEAKRAAEEARVASDAQRKAERAAARKALRKASKRAVRRSVNADAAAPAVPGAGTPGASILESAKATAGLHRSRKAARRLRYVADFETGTGATDARATSATAERLQDALGDHRDAAVFAEYVLLTAARAEAAGESGFTYGLLYQRSLDRAAAALDEAAAARRALRRAVD
ncbi:CYTH and CHAD domain-containing protein [Herbiconiux sp.]|uniref:CYTH and CHAD domain-containing protein n=1 Tax=Herbiconiux sp. TaxID=1871186 RepID=UPI0025BC1A11|nr:CYTH and CHAD domain-containing protein [Herbiconiux sp.]